MKINRVQKAIKDINIDIFCGSAEEYAKLLDNDSIHLVVTSPPYNCGIKYDVYGQLPTASIWGGGSQ
jgi:hypothetical protein